MIRLQWFVCTRGVIHVRVAYVIVWNGVLVVLRPRPEREHEFRTPTLDKWRLQASKADLN
jgi:hypothetical protein